MPRESRHAGITCTSAGIRVFQRAHRAIRGASRRALGFVEGIKCPAVSRGVFNPFALVNLPERSIVPFLVVATKYIYTYICNVYMYVRIRTIREIAAFRIRDTFRRLNDVVLLPGSGFTRLCRGSFAVVYDFSTIFF